MKVSSVAFPKKWISTQELTYDYAFGKINISSDFYEFAFTPCFDFFKKNYDRPVYLSGYELKLFKYRMSTKKGILNSSFLKTDSLLSMKAKINSGISGGPWYFKKNKENIQIGVTSAKIKSFPNSIWAPIWTRLAKQILEELSITKKNEVII